MPEVESWSEYRIHLIKTLERLEDSINGLSQRIDAAAKDGTGELGRTREELRREIATVSAEVVGLKIRFGMQEVRTGLLGLAAGSVPAIIAAVIWFMTQR